jgi:hypothetical protein
VIRISSLPNDDDLPLFPDPNALNDEPLMTIQQAATFIGRLTGKKPNVSTIWRWCLKGVRGVILQSICVGGQRFVSRSALARFIEQSTARGSADTKASAPPPTVQSPTRQSDRRREEIEAARRRLDDLTGSSRPRPDSARRST